ncbi:uncharacterized protein B0I36DRAFT_369221 [Microdochium trichocladiopsis]|uniref:Uncharacterized protein n=1 Tax=Microdochium trichocladiopsis TaxID=1682393 RepID=A0A9P8XRU5_9PEZI|nr:uncharacterized protein B0I36DRAFT_369221 [Microdochium trichocladiopsis]KAH7014242.1 hypothetical protein B0I36DRAFT_369221 [Microdochium trichocladiopsis]
MHSTDQAHTITMAALPPTPSELELTVRSLAAQHRTIETLAPVLQPVLDQALSASTAAVSKSASFTTDRSQIRKSAVEHALSSKMTKAEITMYNKWQSGLVKIPVAKNQSTGKATEGNVPWLFLKHTSLVPLVNAMVKIHDIEEEMLATRLERIRKIVDAAAKESERVKRKLVKDLTSSLTKLEEKDRRFTPFSRQKKGQDDAKEKEAKATAKAERRLEKKLRHEQEKRQRKLLLSNSLTSPKSLTNRPSKSLEREIRSASRLPVASLYRVAAPVQEQDATLGDKQRAGGGGMKRARSPSMEAGSVAWHANKRAKLTDAWLQCNENGQDIE